MMSYCMDCGGLLKEVYHSEREGTVPRCTVCGKFQFPVYSCAVSMIVQSPDKERILLIQQYGSKDNILVAGYISKGESAEQAVIREVKEETGLDITELSYNKSEYFPKTNTLMINFVCTAADDDLSGVDSAEVDKAAWFSRSEAAEKIRPGSLAKKFLMNYLADL